MLLNLTLTSWLVAATVLVMSCSKCVSLSVQPGVSSTVGVVGKGYISILAAKVAAKKGYKVWLAIPPGDGEKEKVESLIYEDPSADDKLPLELISSLDTEAIAERLDQSDAVVLASDDSNAPLSSSALEFVLRLDGCSKLKRVVCMSRNLNKEGYGFFTKASKLSSNGEVWSPDNSLIQQFSTMENFIKGKSSEIGFDYTIARAGTLKGGACGEVGGDDYCPQFLASRYYELTKKDIVTWQLLFDCNGRGVEVKKGDVLPGPGNRAVFTASAPEPCVGDTSRAGIAEAMIMSLREDSAANCDFGVGASTARKPPSDDEWKSIFSSL